MSENNREYDGNENVENSEPDTGAEDSNKDGVVIKKQHIIFLVMIFIVLLIVTFLVGITLNCSGGEDTTKVNAQVSDTSFDIDPNAGSWNGSVPSDESSTASKGIAIPGYPSITIPANTQDVTVALLNPENNPCYFTFELVLTNAEDDDSDDETIYTSKLVPPGDAITSITLSRPLEAGEYDAVIKISTTSLETGGAMNGANVKTKLIVK